MKYLIYTFLSFALYLPHLEAGQSLAQLERELHSAEKEIKNFESKITFLKQAIAKKEIEQISAQVIKVQKKVASGAVKPHEHPFTREREVLNRIIHEVPNNSKEAQEILDQILTLITLENS